MPYDDQDSTGQYTNRCSVLWAIKIILLSKGSKQARGHLAFYSLGSKGSFSWGQDVREWR